MSLKQIYNKQQTRIVEQGEQTKSLLPNRKTLSNRFQSWLKKLINFKSSHSLEETVSEIIEEYDPSRQRMTEEEQKTLHNFLEFGNKKVSDIVIPRSDICAVKSNATLEMVIESFYNFAHTRIVVYKEDLDDIIGFIHIKDLILVLAGKKSFNILNLLRNTILVAPSMKLHDLLTQMQKQRTHIARVVDEYGGTYGIVTMEDIIEVIFGEIDDEHDVKNTIKKYKIVNEHTIITDARLDIGELEKLLKIKLKNADDDFETVGGLILAKHGCMPIKGTLINIADNINAEIIAANPRSLKIIKILIED